MKDEKIDRVVDGLLDSCGTKRSKKDKKDNKYGKIKAESKLNEEESNPFDLYEPDEDDDKAKQKEQLAAQKLATKEIKQALKVAAQVIRKHKKVGVTDSASKEEISGYLYSII